MVRASHYWWWSMLCSLGLGILVVSVPLTADASTWSTNDWFTKLHPTPASFTHLGNGEFSGFTTTGISFTQTNVPNAYGIRVQQFTMGEHSHLIVNGEIIYDLTQFSIRLSQFASA